MTKLQQDKMTEIDIARIADMFFQQMGWELFPEVVLTNFGGRPDLNAVKNSLCMIIECKKTFSYPVIEQLARRQEEMAHWSKNQSTKEHKRRGMPHLLIAFTEKATSSHSALKTRIIKELRIGHYSVSRKPHCDSFLSSMTDKLGEFKHYGDGKYYTMQFENYRYEVRMEIEPKLQIGSRQTAHRIVNKLHADMKDGVAAGSSGKEGGQVTPFRMTMNKVKRVLDSGGEWHIVNILKEINLHHGGHHYTTDKAATQGIPKYIVDMGYGKKVNDYPPLFSALN